MFQTIYKRISIIAAFALVFQAFALMFVSQTEAALSGASMRPDRMVQSVTTDFLVVIDTDAATTIEAIKVEFPAGYDVTSAAISGSAVPTSYGSYGTLTAVTNPSINISGQDVTVDIDPISTAGAYGVYLTDIINPTTVGMYNPVIVTTDDNAGANTIDSTVIATYVVSDNAAATDGDQIVVTAEVPPTYIFSITDNDIDLIGQINTVEYPGTTFNSGETPATVSVETSADNGHILWMSTNDASGLTSTTASSSIDYPAASGVQSLVTPNNGFVIDVDNVGNSSGSLAIDAEFDGATTDEGGVFSAANTFKEIASATGQTDPATNGGEDQVDIIPRVKLDTTIPEADDYTATLTVVGAGDF